MIRILFSKLTKIINNFFPLPYDYHNNLNQYNEIKVPNQTIFGDKDLYDLNLYLGKIIGDDELAGSVVSFNNLNKHEGISKNFLVWEIDPNLMKRDESQMLLSWEPNFGWSWFTDF